jgi:hypothetical protein
VPWTALTVTENAATKPVPFVPSSTLVVLSDTVIPGEADAARVIIPARLSVLLTLKLRIPGEGVSMGGQGPPQSRLKSPTLMVSMKE